MPFVKGQQANPYGRPKGSKNKKNRVKKHLEGLLEKTLPVIEQEMQAASPEVRRSFFMDLANIAMRSKKQSI
jgi:hypothetical protein